MQMVIKAGLNLKRDVHSMRDEDALALGFVVAVVSLFIQLNPRAQNVSRP